MRLKITLEVASEVYGSVLPISYQYELTEAVHRLLTAESSAFVTWLSINGFTPEDNEHFQLYSISNLYVPRIYVQGDRLQLNVPRVQFWISIYPETATREFFEQVLMNKEMIIGDHISRVMFRIKAIDLVSPVQYMPVMEYQSLSPVVVQGMRPNRSIEYLFPQNPCFGEFIVQELIDRWEHIHRQPYLGDRRFRFQLLQAEKRKAVTISSGRLSQKKVIGYMLKFRLSLDPQLQEMAYVCGIGDYVNLGFGYLELLQKSAD